MVEVTDLAHPDPADGVPPTDGLRLLAADDTRVVIRPSGTEPKVKCYLEVIVPVEEHASTPTLGQARRRPAAAWTPSAPDVAAAPRPDPGGRPSCS